MQQYHEDYHYLGYRDCARLIHQQFGDGPLTLVGGVGSGAFTGALTTYLRDLRGDTELIGVQPFESVTFASDPVGDPVASISGIGSPVPFRHVRHALYDRVHWIAHEQAISATVALYREHGVFARMSSGCTYLAAAWEARLHPHRQYLFIAADTGHRYMDSVYRKHASVMPAAGLEPKVIDDLGDLSLPWSVMDWHRRPFAMPPDSALLASATGNVTSRYVSYGREIIGMAKRHAAVQEYIPNVRTNEKRVIVAGDTPVSGFLRFHRDNDNRADATVGAQYAPLELTDDERAFIARLGKRMMDHGIFYVGVDLAYPYVIEVNMENPGGVNYHRRATGETTPPRRSTRSWQLSAPPESCRPSRHSRPA
ncbi:pyridoxal-phosphate dependent enzyme [Streptomyces sp. ISL-10]|uniref:pyridoxal-phosphate dependent enzyme n=1 Tax=Streptomyces sp. ISL-10 TaxID=2819172 RepID=UPI002035B115|nr:pyridoxal-phosphate dependent enzyme [Streptomyces sp. ISL-10]